MYGSRQEENAKRKAQEGGYSLYNHLYHYLMDNFEPSNMDSSDLHYKAFKMLIVEGMNYSIKGGKQPSIDAIKYDARKAMEAFRANDGKEGTTSDHLGNRQGDTLATIKDNISDLRY